MLTLAGCGRPQPASIQVVADGIDQVAPAEIRKALEQLGSSDAKQQRSGLEFVEKFPSLTQTHRNLLEELATNGASPAVKQQAQTLLDR